MAFVKVDKTSAGPRNAMGLTIRMGAGLHDGKTPRGIYVSISRPLAEAAGWKPKLNPGSVLQRETLGVFVHEGIAEDAGFWMLEQTDDPRGYILGTSRGMGSAFVMTIAITRIKHYVLNDASIYPHEVSYSIDNNTVLIECPDWLRYNSLTVPAPTPTTVAELRPDRQQRRAAHSTRK